MVSWVAISFKKLHQTNPRRIKFTSFRQFFYNWLYDDNTGGPIRALSLTDVTRLDVVLHCRPIGMRRAVTCPCQSNLMMLSIQILSSIIIYMLHCLFAKTGKCRFKCFQIYCFRFVVDKLWDFSSKKVQIHFLLILPLCFKFLDKNLVKIPDFFLLISWLQWWTLWRGIVQNEISFYRNYVKLNVQKNTDFSIPRYIEPLDNSWTISRFPPLGPTL